ncbi:MAG: phage tail tape measure protein [Halanaerobiales bacterium]|nr:phage tail tape measure protein [Halanaerobiales bacterium]
MDRATLEMVIRARQELAGLDETIRKTRQFGLAFGETARKVNAYARKIVAAVAKMQAAIKKLHNTFRTLRNVALKAFTAIVAFNAIPIVFFAKFEQKMANVNTLLDVSEKKFHQLGQGVIDISNRIGESAETLSVALYDIVSAGVAADNSLGVLDISARAAKAGMTNAQTAVKAGLATINSYNLSISELSRVYDLQFQTVRKGVITYEQLAGAQGQLLPSARKLNESLENMYGSLAFITKQGLSAELASISLARAYDALIEKTDKLAAAGVEVYDEFGNFRGIVDIVEELSQKLEGLSDEQMQDVLEGIGFEIRAARAIIPMIKNIDGLRESIEAMDDSAGSMETAFVKATDTIAFHWDRAKENVINAIRDMGSGWREEINELLDRVSAWGRALQDFVTDNREAIKSILTFAIRLTATVAAFAIVATAIISLMTPIGMVTAGIALLGSVWYLNLWDIRSVTERVISYVLGKWDELKTWWTETTWLEKAQNIGALALNIADFAWNSVKDIGKSLWNWIKAKLDANDDGEVSINEIIEVALNVSLVLGSITVAFTLALLMKTIIKKLIAAGILVAKGLALGGLALAAGLAIGAALLVALDPEINNIQEWKEKFIEGLQYLFSKEFWRDIWTIAKIEWQLMWNDAKDWLKTFFGRYFTKDFWSGIFDNMKQAWRDAWKDMSTWQTTPTGGIWDWFKDNSEWIPPFTRKASGGYISGPGTSTSDSIPAMLSNGEFVVNAAATEKWLPILEAINSGNVSGFSSGGGAKTDKQWFAWDYNKFSNTNLRALQDVNLQDNPILYYLSQIAHDTQNFRHVVDLVSGVQQMVQDVKDNYAELQTQAEELQKKLEEERDKLKQSADTKVDWNNFVPILANIMDNALFDLEGIIDNSTAALLSGIVSALRSFSEVEGGFLGAWGELKVAWDLIKTGDFKDAIGVLSQGTVEGIASIFEGIKNAIIAGVEESARKAAEAFQEAIKEFNEAVDKFKESIVQGGSLQAANFDYHSAIKEAEDAAEKYAIKLAEERRASATKRGGLFGGLLGGIVGFLFGGPAGAAIGAGIGGAGGAAAGSLRNYYRDSDYQKKLAELMKEIREKIDELLETAFGLDTVQITANLNQAIIGAVESGKNFALEIGKSLYGQVKNSLQSVFLWAQNNIIQQYLDPVIENMKEKITNAIITGEQIDFTNLLDIQDLIKAAEAAEKLGKDLEEFTGQLKQQLIDAGIGEEIIYAIFPPDILTQQVMEALRNAMSTAMDSGNILDFTKALGQSIYENAKQSLINAFMESAVYQEMFKRWFDVSGINFTGNLEQDFASMQNMLSQLQDELRKAGLDFNFTEVPGEDPPPPSGDYYSGARTDGEKATIINNHYYYQPKIEYLFGDEKEVVYRGFLDWEKQLKKDEA